MQEKGNLSAVGSCELSKQSGAAGLSACLALPCLLAALSPALGVHARVCAHTQGPGLLMVPWPACCRMSGVNGGRRGQPVSLGTGVAGPGPALPTTKGSVSQPQPRPSA